MRCTSSSGRSVRRRCICSATASAASPSCDAWNATRSNRPAAAEELLYAHQRQWSHERPLGIIAGNNPLSLGRLMVDFHEPNDGTVAVSETALPGATAQVVLPVSHTGMLLSARVAHEVGQFFDNGRFGP